MAEIVFIHGIAQQQSAAPEQEQIWGLALAGGLQLAGFTDEADRLRMPLGMPGRIDARMAFYGDLFVRPGAQGGYGDDIVLSDEQYAIADEIALDWLEQVAERATNPRTRDSAMLELEELSGRMGRQKQGRGAVIRRAIDALTRVPGVADVGMAIVSRYIVGALKQVTLYLTDPLVRDLTLERVESLLTPDTRIIIGHSLGSVVAYEAAHRLKTPLPLMLTIGSPLGMRRVVYENLTPVASFPPKVRRWVNVADRDDYIATAPDLEPLFGLTMPEGAIMEGSMVDNENEPHGAKRYLVKVEVGRPVGETLRYSA